MDTLAVLYIPWNKDTYIHVFNVASSPFKEEATFLFSENETPVNINLNSHSLANLSCKNVDESGDNKDVLEPSYNQGRTVYQLSKYVKYDLQNGNLLVLNEEGTEITVYNRDNSSVQTLQRLETDSEITEGSVKEFGNNQVYENASYTSQTIEDVAGGNGILYISKGYETVVALFCKDESGTLNVKNIKRFTPNGVYTGDSSQSVNFDSTVANGSSNTDGTTNLDTNVDNLFNNLTTTLDNKTDYSGDKSFLKDFFKYYIKKHSTDASNNEVNGSNDIVTALAEQNTGDFNLNDYILKTQVVPPVCPSCPACNNCSGTCTNCGGNGGNGTLTVDGSSNVVGDDVSKKNEKNVASNVIDATGNVASTTVDAAGNVVAGTVDAAGNVVAGTVDAAGNVVSGTIGAAGNIVSSTVGAVGDVASSLVSAGSDIGASASQNQNYMNQSSQNAMNSNTQVMANNQSDPYSYYGQLPTKKSSQYMPITADFSSFGK